MKQCIITGLPTSRNFKKWPVHPDVLTVAREMTDKDKNLTLRKILSSDMKRKQLMAELGNRSNHWRKFLYPTTHVEPKYNKKIIT